MVQVIQVKRRIGGAAGAPPSLAAGELAFNNTDNALYVGADAGGTVVPLVHNLRQLEIHASSPAQTVLGGAKTFTVGTVALPGGTLKITGGAAGQALTTDGAGNLAFAPVVAASQQFIGSLDATAGTVELTVQAGGGAVLPPAGTSNGWYVITDVAGTVAAANPAGIPAGVYQIGDWVISNGTVWNHLEFGGIDSVTAADVGVVAPVTGGTNVQDVLESMQAAAANFVSGPATSLVGNIPTYADTTGLLIDGGVPLANLATVTYVDAENAAQDTIIAANAAFVAAQPAIDAAQDAAIAAAGDVVGPAASVVDNIAVYSNLTGKLIKDGGMTIAAINAAIAAKGDVVGPAAAVVANNLAAFDTTTGKLIKDSGQSVASIQTYVDNAIAAIPGTTINVAAPITGDGSVATPLGFSGIVAEAVIFGGNGLTATPLTLLAVDGGTY